MSASKWPLVWRLWKNQVAWVEKNGKGFYHYSEDGKRGDPDQSIYAALGLGQPTNPLETKECIERGVFAMINECSLALIEDRIVETPNEVDLAMIMGTGFPHSAAV